MKRERILTWKPGHFRLQSPGVMVGRRSYLVDAAVAAVLAALLLTLTAGLGVVAFVTIPLLLVLLLTLLVESVVRRRRERRRRRRRIQR